MKTFLISLLLFTNLFSYSQSNRIFGEVYIKDVNILNDTLLRKNYSFNMYYSKDSCIDATKKKISRRNDYTFDFKISKSNLRKYKYIHFESFDHSIVLQISQILNTKQTLIFDSVNSNDLSAFHNSTPNSGNPPLMIVKKPAIYLYPITEQKISIHHDFKGQILNTYPVYNNGWNVIAKPNGSLLNLDDNRLYSYLFWDGAYNFPVSHYNFKDGFVVTKHETISFLQEKLAFIGLNTTEINDFIVFWLPALSENESNFIHFRINDNIDQSSFLTIHPKPETEIRVFMEFMSLENFDKTNIISEQILPKIERKGFTMVEWGGAEVKKEMLMNLVVE